MVQGLQKNPILFSDINIACVWVGEKGGSISFSKIQAWT